MSKEKGLTNFKRFCPKCNIITCNMACPHCGGNTRRVNAERFRRNRTSRTMGEVAGV